MILKTKNDIWNWLEIYDNQYKNNIEKNAYECIDIHDEINQPLFNAIIQKDNLPYDYFEQLKIDGHCYFPVIHKAVYIRSKLLFQKMVEIGCLSENDEKFFFYKRSYLLV